MNDITLRPPGQASTRHAWCVMPLSCWESKVGPALLRCSWPSGQRSQAKPPGDIA
jgi:hypothetical protein